MNGGPGWWGGVRKEVRGQGEEKDTVEPEKTSGGEGGDQPAPLARDRRKKGEILEGVSSPLEFDRGN